MTTSTILSRRSLLAGMGTGGAAIALGGCSTLGGFGGFGLLDGIRNILLLSSERAFARLTQPVGWYDGQIAKLALGDVLGSRGDILSTILTSGIVKDRLEREFAQIAVEGAYRAAPLVYDTVRTIGISNALALINGGPTAATGFLRQNMGATLVEAMVPEIGDAMRISQDPVIGQLIAGVTGVDAGAIVGNFAREADDAIWNQIGVEETGIRANPRETGDPAIIAVLTGANAL